MSRILAPHKEQDGWVYVRVARRARPWHGRKMPGGGRVAVGAPLGLADKPGLTAFYHDNTDVSRIISSRRVEEAVETADYMRLCDAQDLGYQRMRHGDERLWYVFEMGRDLHVIYGAHGETLREAYHRYLAVRR